jgi:pantoate--beta-alanine ligase
MQIIRTVKEMQAASEGFRREGKKIALVPTMGYLHEGHLALVRRGREMADIVAVSIFVNPIQFGPSEDLARYPRDFERDRAALERERTDIIYFPDVGEMYPEGYSTYIEVKELADHLCGLSRAGHFRGVATVVAKLFNATKPHYAIFGQKDFQQLKVIERMVRDLNMDLEIIGHPTVREADGLAMSSRNTYLSEAERQVALLVPAAIGKVRAVFAGGERRAEALRGEALKMLGSKSGIEVEYVNICDAETLCDVERVETRGLIAVAVRVGKTRLIDNSILTES